ncbi:hypothetical protein C9E82_17470 [Paracoccus siganidrum]|nr:hypothetical protein C9E82_17470 [Paracoccus siganidrum]
MFLLNMFIGLGGICAAARMQPGAGRTGDVARGPWITWHSAARGRIAGRHAAARRRAGLRIPPDRDPVALMWLICPAQSDRSQTAGQFGQMV